MHRGSAFLQGLFPFVGEGYDRPMLFDPSLRYTVPPSGLAQMVYVRAGSSADDMVCLVLTRDRTPMRYVPVGAGGDTHVPLRIVEDLPGGTVAEVYLAAPVGCAGTLALDVGFIEL